MKLLVVIDMQNDFVTGVLGTKEAVRITEAIEQMVANYEGEIVFTKDTHTTEYLTTQEGRKLPVEHCVKGTLGASLIPSLECICEEKKTKVFEKPTFGSVALGEYVRELVKNGLTQVDLIGVCTDICVISNALVIKAFAPEVEVNVYEDLTAGVSVESHNTALEAMKQCQINVVKFAT